MIPLRRWSKPASLVLSSGLLFVAGCGPGDSTNPSNTTKFENSAPATSTSPASPPSAEPNSFDEVTARLDRGGALYAYLSTAQWLEGLSDQLSKLRASIPTDGMNEKDRKEMNQVFDTATSFIKSSGIEQISGFGVSSLAVEPGAYRNTFFLHHYKGKEIGFLNTLFGTAPHNLTALDLLPANTALASNGDYDIAGLIRAVLQTIDKSGVPEWQKGKAESLQKFQQSTGMTLDEFLGSLGQEINLVLTLDPAKQIEVPAGNAGTMKVAAPRLALLIEVKDDKFFNKIDQLLAGLPKEMVQITKTDEPGLKMRTTSYPALPDFEVRPTVARWDKFLVIASDDRLIRDMIAVQKGGAGFKASPAFAKMSAGLPTQGNGFSVVTQAFAGTVRNVQKQALASQKGASAAQTEWLSKLMLSDATGDSYGVSGHVENGWLAVTKGPTGVGKVLAPLVIAPVAFAAGAALPVFSKVQQKSTATKSLAQAKQIGLALKLYASDNDGKYPASLDALVPTYLADTKLFVSPFAPDEPMGYTYHPGLTESMPPETVLLEDKFAPGAAGQKVIVHLDDTGEVTKSADE